VDPPRSLGSTPLSTRRPEGETGTAFPKQDAPSSAPGLHIESPERPGTSSGGSPSRTARQRRSATTQRDTRWSSPIPKPASCAQQSNTAGQCISASVANSLSPENAPRRKRAESYRGIRRTPIRRLPCGSDQARRRSSIGHTSTRPRRISVTLSSTLRRRARLSGPIS